MQAIRLRILILMRPRLAMVKGGCAIAPMLEQPNGTVLVVHFSPFWPVHTYTCRHAGQRYHASWGERAMFAYNPIKVVMQMLLQLPSCMHMNYPQLLSSLFTWYIGCRCNVPGTNA